MHIHTPDTLNTAMKRGELPCQIAALERIQAGLERTDIFYSEGRVYIGRERARPIFRLLAERGWHILWANKWGDGRDLPDQDDGYDVHFVVSASPPPYFSRPGLGNTCYRVSPGPGSTAIETGPFPIPACPR